MTSGIQAGAVTAITKLLDRTMRTGIRWLLAALLVPCAMAQTPEADRQREYYREQDRQRETARRAQEEINGSKGQGSQGSDSSSGRRTTKK